MSLWREADPITGRYRRYPITVPTMTDSENRQIARLLPTPGETTRERDNRIWEVADRYATLHRNERGIYNRYISRLVPFPLETDAQLRDRASITARSVESARPRRHDPTP